MEIQKFVWNVLLFNINILLTHKKDYVNKVLY